MFRRTFDSQFKIDAILLTFSFEMLLFKISRRHFSSYFLQRSLPSTSPKEFSEIISDVASYRHFLPHCTSSRVIRQASPLSFDAELTIGFSKFTESYVSRVSIEKLHDRVRIQSIGDSLQVLKKLNSLWEIKGSSGMPLDLESETEIEYTLEYQFTSGLLQASSSLVFPLIAHQTLDAFVSRSKALGAAQKKEKSGSHEETRVQEMLQMLLESRSIEENEFKNYSEISKKDKRKRKLIQEAIELTQGATEKHRRKLTFLIRDIMSI